MSSATAHLRSEHELIEKTLEAFENVAKTLHEESQGDIHHRKDL